MSQTVQIFASTHNVITSDIVGNQNKFVTLLSQLCYHILIKRMEHRSRHSELYFLFFAKDTQETFPLRFFRLFLYASLHNYRHLSLIHI